MRLVLDTDVVLSGLRSVTGGSRILLFAIEAKAVTPRIGVATLIEYEAVLTRSEHRSVTGLGVEEVDRFLNGFMMYADEVAPHFRLRPSIRDPDDELFMELAINGQAEALVTFNVGDYRPIGSRSAVQTIEVCRPGDILRRLPWRPTPTSGSTFLPR